MRSSMMTMVVCWRRWNPHEHPHVLYISRKQIHRPTFCSRQYRAVFVFWLQAGKLSTETMIVDNEDITPASQRTSMWSMSSTSRHRRDIPLTNVRAGSSRSASEIHKIPDHAGKQSAADMSLRLSGCGAERSIKAKRRVIKVIAIHPCRWQIILTDLL